MSDRISSYQMNLGSLNNILRNQARVAQSEQRVATGIRVQTPADDPVAAARILQLDQDIELTDQYIRNIKSVTGRLELQEGYLKGSEEVLQRVRELAVQAGGGSLSIEDRRAIASEMKVRLEELLQLTNAKDASGDYLFSGYSGQTQPFVEAAGGGFVYQGDEGQRQIRISNSARIPASDNGKDIFLDVPVDNPSFITNASPRNQGNPPGVISAGVTVDEEALQDLFPDDAIITFNNELDGNPPGRNFTVRRRSDNQVIDSLKNVSFAPGQAISFAGMQVRITGEPRPGDNFTVETTSKQGPLQTIQKMIEGLDVLPDTPEGTQNLANLVAESLDNLDAGIENLSIYRAKIGARINTAESTLDVHEESKLTLQDVRKNLKEVDYAEAVSQLQMETMILEASQQAYAKVSSLSLFNFIR
ncbi:flagellar hook-associated protein 3 [Natronospirillum operosum]|uniref:Flagellar hook-associated protein 3 n=1 Tax=Natronospirillum operosum TaxID=2759953 RepID=A0A4Z0WG33_9GAMM|nr:flagellar hook-associated protein FlgL [Natronospirillum operosum]TGG95990.1 flagellar hook-associated protein 3 [Natronospirillum operosum]